jgi:hypothetical protein
VPETCRVWDDDIGRLDIAMNNIPRVSCSEAPRDLDQQVQRAGSGRKSAGDHLRKGLPLVIGHHDKQVVIGSLPDAVDGTDIRVIEGRGRARLAKQTLLVAFIEGCF